MADYDRGIKAVAHVAGRQLARLAGVECQEWAPLESTLQATTERLADRVFLGRQGRERFVVYMEFYTYWKEEALWDVLEKAGMLSKREQLPTVCLLFVLRPKGYRPHNGQLRLTVGGHPTQQLWFHEVLLWEQEPQEWWELAPPLMTLFPLCQHSLPPQEAVWRAASVIEKEEPNLAERSDFLAILALFGRLAYPRLGVWEIIGREKMRESTFFDEVRAEGALEGERKNILRVLRALPDGGPCGGCGGPGNPRRYESAGFVARPGRHLPDLEPISQGVAGDQGRALKPPRPHSPPRRPISTPVRNTSTPPTTTWRIADSHGVSM